MKRIVMAAATCASLIWVTTGCYTTVAVNFGNGTTRNVRVRSSETGREIDVPSEKFKKLSNSIGDLIVTTHTGEQVYFLRVAPFDVDPKFHTIERSVFGPNSVTLNVKLETNMQLYVVMPRSTSEMSAAQPPGYPKTPQVKETE